MNNPNAAANLGPFKPGHATPRRSRDVERCLKLARRHCPKAMLLLIQCMRDPEASWPERIKAAKASSTPASPKIPPPSKRSSARTAAPRFLNVRFVSPNGSISDTPNFDDQAARRDVAKVVDEQPINVTPRRLPPPRVVHDAEQEIAVFAGASATIE